ncbi:MAG: hypothetical protein DMD54_16760 [Gemmatimonadetes bacterium]|nr:MAG: hypothetical protein DMD54_16760 [Gemmatimonadota bacterium]
MSPARSTLVLATVSLIASLHRELTAQVPFWRPLVAIGDEVDNRARLAHLNHGGTDGAYLLRTASRLTPALEGDSTSLRWAFVLPEIAVVDNTALPFSLNDGALWAGRGWTGGLRTGIRAEWGRWFLILAPELIVSENRSYQLADPLTVPPRPLDRHPLSSPWHLSPSIDAPLRFGYSGFGVLDPGQSTLGVRFGPLVAGVSTESEWWGPGIHNAILLSNNAPGIPRVLIRTARPLHALAGKLEGTWFLGGLSESPFFDSNSGNDRRSITGGALVWMPNFADGLALGLARTVYASLSTWRDLPAHAFDVALGQGPSREQLISLFGRWVFPADHFAAHFEWARTEFPRGLRDFLTAPNHSQGYTLGLEWAAPAGRARFLRLQAEVTYLERSPSYRDRPLASFYTSATVVQGYTQRGQVIGAAIGQGGSSQWLGLDYFAPRWRVGVFGGRIRWDDDALYTFPTPLTAIAANKWCSHDVSLFGGVTAALERNWGRLHVSLTRGERLNVFFHNLTQCDLEPNPLPIRDARNTTLELRFSPP